MKIYFRKEICRPHAVDTVNCRCIGTIRLVRRDGWRGAPTPTVPPEWSKIYFRQEICAPMPVGGRHSLPRGDGQAHRYHFQLFTTLRIKTKKAPEKQVLFKLKLIN